MNYQLISDQSGLDSALAQIRDMNPLAVDMEMENNFHHYGLHLALIQIATPGNDVFIIDPLALHDLKPLGALLAGSRHELIMHNADFDRRTCFQLYGWILGKTFDTQIAAMFCGFKQPGLANLLNELFGMKIDKRYQKQDWLKRPLSRPALDYAARDVNMLHALQEILTVRLAGRLEWAKEEFGRAEKTLASAYPVSAHCRIKHSAALSPRSLSVLKALVDFRESAARRFDLPPQFVIRDALLIELARRPPKDGEKIKSFRGLHPALYRKHGRDGLMQAIQAGLNAPEEIHPARKSRHSLPPAAQNWEKRLKDMRRWRLEKATALNLEQHLLFDAEVMVWFARNPGRPAPPYIAGRIRNWQRDFLLPEFLNLFGESSLRQN
ncbi:MAG: HRDC domain-containing protein [Kiritimatiellae bacterium]|nr:HRDC domain-containing protein [Kiritimatiellia bacterium]